MARIEKLEQCHPERNREGPEPQPSFDKIYSSYSDKAYALAFRMTGDSELAYDIVQEAFIAIYNNLSKFSPWRTYYTEAEYHEVIPPHESMALLFDKMKKKQQH